MRKIKLLIMLAISRGYFTVSDQGSTIYLPNNKNVLQAIRNELDNIKYIVDEMIQDIELDSFNQD